MTLLGCGGQVCDGVDYAWVEADSCVAVREASGASRAILIAAGVVTDGRLTEVRRGTGLVVHGSLGWTLLDGRYVVGYTFGSTTEVGSGLSALLHEELHRLGAGRDDHAEWRELGYYGLDDAFQVLLDGRSGPFYEAYPVTDVQRAGLVSAGLPYPVR